MNWTHFNLATMPGAPLLAGLDTFWILLVIAIVLFLVRLVSGRRVV